MVIQNMAAHGHGAATSEHGIITVSVQVSSKTEETGVQRHERDAECIQSNNIRNQSQGAQMHSVPETCIS